MRHPGGVTFSRHFEEPHGAEVSGSSMSSGYAHAYVAERYRERDVKRMEEINETLRTVWHCRYCGASLSDYRAGKTPGLCVGRGCRKKAAREERTP